MSPKTRSSSRRADAARSAMSQALEEVAEESSTKIPILNERNFREWKRCVRTRLLKKGVFKTLKIQEISAEDTVQMAQEKAYGIIIESLPDGMAERYLDDDTIDTPRKLMESIEGNRTIVNKELTKAMLTDIASFVWESGDPDIEYNRFTRMYQQYTSAGGVMTEADAVYYLLACAPTKYAVTADKILTSSTITLDAAYTELVIKQRKMIHAATLRKGMAQAKDKKPAAPKQVKKEPRPRNDKALFCAYCKDPNHVIAECEKLKKRKETEKSEKQKANTAEEKTKSDKPKTISLMAKLIEDESSNEKQHQSLTSYFIANEARHTSNYAKNEWIMDSGATKHMSGDEECFQQINREPIQDYIEVANEQKVPILGKGKVTLWGKGTKTSINLHDVLYAPGLSRNLFSISTVIKKGCTVEFQETGATISKNGNIFLRATLKDGLYILETGKRRGRRTEANAATQIKENDLEKHRKLCHFTTDGAQDCEDCARGKITRLISKRHEEEETTEPLGLIHTDTLELPVRSNGKKKYVLSFIDHATRYTKLRFLSKKSDGADAMIEMVKEAEKEQGKEVKIIRCDGGSEYITTKLINYLRDRGIKLQETHRDAPYENGMAERYNRTLLEATRTNLIQSNMPERFWAESMDTVNYVKNRIKHTTTGKIPYELYYGTVPMTSHLQPWGSPAIVHDQKATKLQPKGKRLIFVGYNEGNTKGYRFCNPHNNEITLSKDARFLQLPSKKYLYVPADAHIEYAIIAKDYGAPENYQEAIQCPDAKKWIEAMQEEYNSLMNKQCWILVKRPSEVKVLRGRWAYALKRNELGIISRHKARHAINGYFQKKGVDYEESFSPVARIETIRIVIALACAKGYTIHQLDIKLAYINGDMDTLVYMEQPAGFHNGDNDQVCLLLKSLYGLKQAGRCWNQKFVQFMTDCGFQQSKVDPCLFIKDDVLVTVYVDDILVAGTPGAVKQFKDQVAETFEAEDMGIIHHLLGIKIDDGEDEISLSQEAYIECVLQKFEMQDAKPVPYPKGKETSQDGEELDISGQGEYRAIVGCLIFIAGSTRPDITYATQQLSQFNGKANLQHLKQAKRVLRYLKNTKSCKLTYKRNSGMQMQYYADASYATEPESKSISGAIFQVGGNTVSWYTRKQSVIAQSTVESEYISLCTATKQAYWIAQMLSEITGKIQLPITAFQDNQGTIRLASNPIISRRSKHIEVKFHYVRDKVNAGFITIDYCPTNDMIADGLTKAIIGPKFEELRSSMGVSNTGKC